LGKTFFLFWGLTVSRRSAFILVFILATVLATVGLVSATSKPSVPEFSLKLVSSEYTIPPVCTIDPYTGENITHPSVHVSNKSVEVSIRNQHPVLALENASLYYNVRVKGHFEDTWTELYSYESPSPGLITSSGTLPPESNSEYTTLYYPVDGFANNTQLDFQVKAFIGDYTTSEPASHSPFVPPTTSFGVIAGTDSGWSDTQTISLNETPTAGFPDTSQPSSTSPSESQNPVEPLSQSGAKVVGWLGLDWILVATLGVIAVFIAFIVLFLHKKRR
jgi:hypothetical protein